MISNEKVSTQYSHRLRCAMYQRFSSNMQRLVSIEDQERVCRETAVFLDCSVQEAFIFNDAARSGKSRLNRSGLDALIAAAKRRPRPFDLVIIDESSRLGRNLEDVLRIYKILKHHGVDLYFASQRLDSRDPNFVLLLTFLAGQDEQQLVRMASSVHRGQKGRVLKGFYTGAPPFGYTTEIQYDPANAGDLSRANQFGSRLVIVDSKAEIVRRIYRLFVSGISIFHIAQMLNEEGVPAARKPRIGEMPSAWNSNLVGRILSNEKYIGVHVWNKTKQYTDPESGSIEVRKKPESEMVRVDCPEWRIISDEQWDQAQQRLAVANTKLTSRRLAGINRGKTKKEYLFSGLLVCGICGGPIVITGGKGTEASYGCRLARYKRGCSNKLRIRADRFSGAMIEAIQSRIMTDDVLEFLERVS